jgi:hypothetical protein
MRRSYTSLSLSACIAVAGHLRKHGIEHESSKSGHFLEQLVKYSACTMQCLGTVKGENNRSVGYFRSSLLDNG